MQVLKARALAARKAREAALEEEEKKRRTAAQAKLAELEERIARRCAAVAHTALRMQTVCLPTRVPLGSSPC